MLSAPIAQGSSPPGLSVRENLYLTISQPVAPTQANELGQRLFILTRRAPDVWQVKQKGKVALIKFDVKR
jgi:hypothetical protein